MLRPDQAEILLQDFVHLGLALTNAPCRKIPSDGSLFLFDSKALPNYDRDPMDWRKANQGFYKEQSLSYIFFDNDTHARAIYFLKSKPHIKLVHYISKEVLKNPRQHTSDPTIQGADESIQRFVQISQRISPNAYSPVQPSQFSASPLGMNSLVSNGSSFSGYAPSVTQRRFYSRSQSTGSALSPVPSENGFDAQSTVSQGSDSSEQSSTTPRASAIASENSGLSQAEKSRLRKAEVARQCRRRKKEYIKGLEQTTAAQAKEIERLKAQLKQSQGRHVNLKHAVGQTCEAINEAIKRGESQEKIQMLVVDLHSGLQSMGPFFRTSCANSMQVLSPNPLIKFLVWMLTQNPEFYSEPDGLWTSLMEKQLKLSATQQSTLLEFRPVANQSRVEMLECLQSLKSTTDQLVRHAAIRRKFVDHIFRTLSSAQVGALIAWISKNPTCMNIINGVWNTSRPAPTTPVVSQGQWPGQSGHVLNQSAISSQTQSLFGVDLGGRSKAEATVEPTSDTMLMDGVDFGERVEHTSTEGCPSGSRGTLWLKTRPIESEHSDRMHATESLKDDMLMSSMDFHESFLLDSQGEISSRDVLFSGMKIGETGL